MLIRARHYATGDLVDVTWTAGRVEALTLTENDRPLSPKAPQPDLEAGWMAPALFDLQINGYEGRNFTSSTLTTEEVCHVVNACRQHGLAGLCPTLVTHSFPTLVHGFSTLRRACAADNSIARALPYFHLEGPYISADDGPRGAHARQHVRPPDWDEFQRLQESAGGRIRLVTLAPETAAALAFIEKLVASGVVVSLGHTAASSAQIRDAVHAGARLSTHLGNGAHALLPRHDNYLWHQLANDNLWASLICDGDHLPPEVVRCILRVKTPARIVLTCDASPLAGLAPGRYREWEQEFEVAPSGKVVVPGTTYLAGSGVLTDVCVSRLLSWGEVGLRDAIDMASIRPRQLLGLPAPALEAGATLDLMLFDWQPGQTLVPRTVLTGPAPSC